MKTNQQKSPIKSGWKGNINGCLENANNSHVQVTEITLKLDASLAWALANILTDESINRNACNLEKDQIESLSTLGAALGRMIDHNAANNAGREILK